MLAILFRIFLEVCLFRRGPQDLPASQLLLLLSLAAHLLASWILALPALGPYRSLAAAFTDTLVLVGLTVALLAQQDRSARFGQTTTALAGTGALVSLLATPPVYWLYHLRQAGGDTATLNLLILLLMIWSIAVTAHIMRHALSTNLAAGAVLAVLYFFVTVMVRDLVFPILN